MRLPFFVALALPGILAGCLSGPGFMKQGAAEQRNEDADPTVAEVISEKDGIITARIGDANITQTVAASSGSEIGGSAVVFPPGSLAIGTEVTIEAAATIATDAAASDLGLGADIGIDAAGTAVAVTAGAAAPSQPFTVVLALPASSLHFGLADAYERLIIIYKVSSGDGLKLGVLTRDSLTVEDGKVKFSASHFGVYQTAFSTAKVESPKEVATTAPILTKAVEKALPEPVWSGSAAAGNGRSAAFSFSVANLGALVRCVLVVDQDQAAPFDRTIALGTATQAEVKALSREAHRIHGRISCLDASGRESQSAWTSFDFAANPVLLTFDEPAATALIVPANASALRLAGTCSEAGRPVAISGALNAAATCESGKWAVGVDASQVADGSLTFVADHDDGQGSKASSASKVLLKDTTAPQVTLFSGAGVAADGVVNAADATATTALVTLTTDGGAVAFTAALSEAGTVCDSNKTYAAQVPSVADLASDGNYVVCARISDSAGNVTYVKSAAITRDTAFPVLSAVTKINEAVDGLVVAAEVGSSSPMISFTAAGHSGASFTVPVTSGACDATRAYSLTAVPAVNALQPLADGNYFICVRVVDAAGNATYGTSPTIQRAATVPVATITGAPGPSSFSLQGVLGVTVGGAGVTQYKYKFGVTASTDCGAPAGYSASFVPVANPIADSTGSDGSKTLCVIATDTYGNVQSLASATSRTWTKDTVPPPPPTGLTVTKATTTLTPSWASGGGDTAGFIVLVREGAWPDPPANGTAYSPGNVINSSTTVKAVTGSGATTFTMNGLTNGVVYYIYLQAFDAALNYSMPIKKRTTSGVADSWQTITSAGAPTARAAPGVWAPSLGKMFVWGGDTTSSTCLSTGAAFNPATNTWTAMGSGGTAPPVRRSHALVWTGSKVLMWGGDNCVSHMNTGSQYDPGTGTWTPTATFGTGRNLFAHAWTGTELFVFSGQGQPNDGGRYNPNTDTWTTISAASAPASRYNAAAVWAPEIQRVLVYGGYNGGWLTNGGVYNPGTNTWETSNSNFLAGAGAPLHSENVKAVWTGSKLIVWDGHNNNTPVVEVGIYDYATDIWSVVNPANNPGGVWPGLRAAVWGDDRMYTWGGSPADGKMFDPAGPSWTSYGAGNPLAGIARGAAAAVWTGAQFLVWGGWDYASGYTNTGGIYTP